MIDDATVAAATPAPGRRAVALGADPIGGGRPIELRPAAAARDDEAVHELEALEEMALMHPGKRRQWAHS